MAILGLGLDLAQIARFEKVYARHGDHLLERIFTDAERAYCELRPRSRMTHYTGRFAVKEAVMKVLGTGWARGVRWRDIEVVRTSGQAPELVLHGVAAEIAQKKGIAKIHITITHDAGLAAAVEIGRAHV